MIRVGTCGYSYPGWIGRLYPKGAKSASMLSFYAERFSAVEVDATYYRVLSASAFASMAQRTPKDFLFSVKLPANGTHAPLENEHMHDDVWLFRQNIAPLMESGKLACGLMQFPYAFKPGARAERRIRNLQEVMQEVPLVAEFRNRAWQTPETLEFLRELGIGWVNVDEPQFESMLRPTSDATGPLAYIRFHGRNYKTWWKGDNKTRFDYVYSREELEPWSERIIDLAAMPETKEVLSFFNTCYQDQALRNADLLEEILEEKVPQDLRKKRKPVALSLFS